MKIVIVGASFAGMAAALEAATFYPDAELVLIDRQTDLLYAPNTVPRLLKGELSAFDQGRVEPWEKLTAAGVTLLLGHELVGLDDQRQLVQLRGAGGDLDLSYDRLILALGASQSRQLADAEVAPYLLEFKATDSSRQAWDKLQSAQKVLVIGSGQMGLELTDSLLAAGKTVTLFEAQNLPLLKHLDQDLAERLLALLEEKAVACHFSCPVEEVVLAQSGQGVVAISQGQTVEGDLVVLATNFTPNTVNLPSGLRQNPDGTIWVDNYLQTNLPNIYAVGDLIQLPLAYFDQGYLPMIKHSFLTGRLAVHNLFEPTLPLPQIKRRVASQVMGWHMLSLGFTQRELALWEDCQSLGRLTEDCCLKVHIRCTDQTILGAQLLSKKKDQELEQVLSLAVEDGKTVADLVCHLLARVELGQGLEQLLSLLFEGVKGGDHEA